MNEVSKEKIEKLFNRLTQEAEKFGYHLNSDKEFTKDLVKSLIINGKRYGYWACPCRLATGKKEDDLDIICPCDYRDADLGEFGTCYCALYVSHDVKEGKKDITSIPDRRQPKNIRDQMKEKISKLSNDLSKPVWRCKVCGYLCARDEPPSVCPICKVKKDRFERFM
jgi:ferredoxin-thioredoxin reductase catalytic subunit